MVSPDSQCGEFGTQLQVFDTSRMRVWHQPVPEDLVDRLAEMERDRPGLAAAVLRVVNRLRPRKAQGSHAA